MSRRPQTSGHPLLRETLLDRRAFLRSVGVGAVGVATLGTGALGACSGDERPSGAGPGPSTGRAPAVPAASVQPYDPGRPYWQQGNFAPIDREVVETQLEVSGAIPASLSGLYVRNGSNPTAAGSVHWFFGDGMVHGLRLERGQACWYRNRWVATTMHALDGRPAPVPGQDVSHANVSLVHYGGRLLALGEIGWPYEIAPDDLSTVGPWSFDGRLGPTMTAHPKIDPDTGQMHFFGYWTGDPLLTYYVADTDGSLVHREQIDLDVALMVHDFAITDRDVIFWLGPLRFGAPDDLLYPDWPFYWDAERPTRIGIMPLGGAASEMRWTEIEPCYVFHGLNAHREGDDIVLHVHRLASVFGTEPDFPPSQLTEWRLDTSRAELRLRSTPLSDVNMDMPTIDRRHTGRPVRHAWCATLSTDGPYGWEYAGLNHVDLGSGRDDRWDPGPMQTAGEAVFVADGDSDDGEGWLLAFLYDRTVDRSSLGVFDAQAVADGPIARIHLPLRVPYGFHGLWLPDADP